MSIPLPPTPILLFLASVALPPRPTSDLLHPRTLSWPFTLLLQDPKTLAHLPTANLNTIAIARAVEQYVLAWVFLGVLSAILRTAGRVRSKYTDEGGDNGTEGLQVKRVLGVRPILRAAIWHLIAWRLVILPTVAVAGKTGLGWDVPTVIGVGGGLVAGGEEVYRLLQLFGLGKDPQTGPSWTLSISHVVLCIHRTLLAGRILSAGLAAAGVGKA